MSEQPKLGISERVGDWVVDAALPIEGLGSAYEAHHTRRDNKRATLLVIQPADFERTREQVAHQVRQFVGLPSFAFFPIRDWGADPDKGLIWLAVRPLQGRSLPAWLEEESQETGAPRRPKTLEQVRLLLDGSVKALGVLETNNVRLGWLCPAQIFVDDLGRSRLVPVPTPFLTIGSGQVTTLRYLASEGFDASASGIKGGDRYSLAVFAFEALRGRTAYEIPPEEPDPVARMTRMKGQDGGLDLGEPFALPLRRAIWLATHRDAHRRPPDMGGLLDALGPLPQVDEPASTAPTVEGGTVAAADVEEDEEDWSWHEDFEQAVDAELDDEEDSVDDFRPIADSAWIRLLFTLVIVAGLFAVWFFFLRHDGTEDEAEAELVPAATEQPLPVASDRSSDYVFPESWRESTSVRTWTYANFPKEWIESIAPESWKRRALDRKKDEAAAREPTPAPQAPPGFVQRDLMLGTDLRHPLPIRLTGLWAAETLYFGIPDTWEIWGDPELHLEITYLDELIPQVSTMGIWTDGQPSGSFFLGSLSEAPGSYPIPLHLLADDGYHANQFAAYHRTKIPCEDGIGEDLWSEVSSDSILRVHYRRRAPPADLGLWPHPFVDHRDPDERLVSLALVGAPEQGSLLAAGLVASTLRKAADWHPTTLRSHLGDLSQAPPGHVVAIAQRQHAGALLKLLRSSRNDEVRRALQAFEAGASEGGGLLALVPRPGSPHHLVLVMLGADDASLADLGRLLASDLASELLSGRAEHVRSVQAQEPLPARHWRDAIPPKQRFTLMDMGFSDQMTSGFRGGHVTIPIHNVPDEKFSPGAGRLEVVFSYSAQVDPRASNLFVYLDQEPIAGLQLKDRKGRHRRRLVVDIPVQRIGPDSELHLVFDLRGYEDRSCLGQAHSMLWGTVHCDTRLTLPRKRWKRIHELGLLRFGAYPFGIRADLSETVFVLPAEPSPRAIHTYLELTEELGRHSRGNRLAFDLHLGPVSRQSHPDRDLVVLDEGPGHSLLESMDLALDLRRDEQNLLRHAYASPLDPDGADLFFQMSPLAWDSGRSALVAYLGSQAPEDILHCDASLGVAHLLSGKVTRMSGCEHVEALSGKDDPYAGTLPIKAGSHRWIRKYYWSLVTILILLVVLGLLVRYRARAMARKKAGESASPDDVYSPPYEE